MIKNFIKFNKSQIGLFVVIATIIVFVSIYFLTQNSDSLNFFNDQKSSYKIKEYVESCMNLQTKDAINKVGLNSGWLYSPQIRYINKDTNEYLIKSGQGFEFFSLKMPYWYYYNDVQKSFEFNIPEFDSENKYSIKNQIQRYLDETLERDCIDGFKNFKDIYNIEYEYKDLKTKVIFDNENIVVTLNLPLKIDTINVNSTEYIDTFEIQTENKLLVPYNLAKDIVSAESKSYFIEKRTLQFLSPYMSTEGRDLLPPFYDMKMVFDFIPWKVNDVKKLTKQILSSNMNLIEFYGTKTNGYKLPLELENNQFANGVINAYNKDYLSENSLVKETNPKLFDKFSNYNIKTNFEYFYPMHFKLSPSLGNQLLIPKPESVTGIVPIFFTSYTTVYEMTMPILFEIKNTQNKNDDFVFNLAIESNIDYNSPLGENENLDLDTSNIINSPKSLICDPTQFISNYIYLNITDPMEGGNRKDFYNDPIKGVEDAFVNFNCKGLSTCYMGQTKINGNTIQKNVTSLKFRLPIDCSPGKLEISKFGYSKLVFDNVNPNLNNEINLGEANMYSQKTMKLEIKILEDGDTRYSSGRSLNKYEKGFLIMENLNDSDLSQVVEFTRINQNNLEINLIPGNYNIQSIIIFENNISVESKEFCYSTGIFSGDECQTIPGFDAESWISGSLEIKNFNIKFNDLFYNDKIIVNILDLRIPSTYDDMENMITDIVDASSDIKPTFEKD